MVYEAMILRMPIVATNAGGSSSILKDKEEGIIVQDGILMLWQEQFMN